VAKINSNGTTRLRDQTPTKCSPQKFSTLFQHISAVAVVNIVDILSRNIAFSFHQNRSVTLKNYWKGVCDQGSVPDPAEGELMTLPRLSSRLGRGTPPPQSPLPSTSSAYRYRHLRRLISMNSLQKSFPHTALNGTNIIQCKKCYMPARWYSDEETFRNCRIFLVWLRCFVVEAVVTSTAAAAAASGGSAATTVIPARLQRANHHRGTNSHNGLI